MKVLFAPDYRHGNAYQQLLADALESGEKIAVDFLHGFRRVMPLARALQKRDDDIFHLHWPEAYFQHELDAADWFRRARYRLDLMLATRRVPLVVTAHDLRPHARNTHAFVFENYRYTMYRARAVIVHSEAARETLAATYGVAREKCVVIPHGDLSVTLGEMPSREAARADLGADENARICLIFGAVEPYKGIEPIVDWWRKNNPRATLVIAGKPITDEYKNRIENLAANASNIRLHLAWQSGENLRQWLAAADCTVFNHHEIFTSGAACLARSIGLPILIPHRLDTVDLMEPHPLVFRFESFEKDFAQQLERAFAARPGFAAAREWRERTSWPLIARETAQVYRRFA